MNKQIEKVADDYQKLSRKMKDLEAKMKPLKSKLIDYGKAHRSEFDEAFQMKFENGTYISLRTKSVVEGNKQSKADLANEFAELQELKLDEKACIEAFAENNRLKKTDENSGFVGYGKRKFRGVCRITQEGFLREVRFLPWVLNVIQI